MRTASAVTQVYPYSVGRCSTCAVSFLVVISLIFQTSLLGAQRSGFDVASIRPHAPGDDSFRVKMPSNGRFTATGCVAKLVLMLAYDVQENQIVGGPAWIATEKWDIEARGDDSVSYSAEETRRMVQTLLEERFALRIHRELQQRPAYILTVAKRGPKFKAPDQFGPINYQVTTNSIRLERGDLARLAQLLSSALGLPVIDRTGLSGHFNLALQWDDAPVGGGSLPGVDAASPPGDRNGSIFAAIQDQLGLRLEAQRAAVEVIVVDRFERPSRN